jgi:hypothetical protein
VKQGNGKI